MMVPVTAQLNLPKQQGQVKCWSRFIVGFSWLLMICGVISVLCNVLCIFSLSDYSSISWYDKYGNFRTLEIDTGSMFLLALIKIIAGGILLYQ